jgi:hypothetical protein
LITDETEIWTDPFAIPDNNNVQEAEVNENIPQPMDIEDIRQPEQLIEIDVLPEPENPVQEVEACHNEVENQENAEGEAQVPLLEQPQQQTRQSARIRAYTERSKAYRESLAKHGMYQTSVKYLKKKREKEEGLDIRYNILPFFFSLIFSSHFLQYACPNDSCQHGHRTTQRASKLFRSNYMLGF